MKKPRQVKAPRPSRANADGSFVRGESSFPDEAAEVKPVEVEADHEVEKKDVPVESWLGNSDAELALSLAESFVEIRRKRYALAETLAPKSIRLFDAIDETEHRMFSTGLSGLDRILDGGFILGNGEIFELNGPTMTGKTQLCLSLVASMAHVHKRKSLFIDSTNSFDVSRIQQILAAKDDQRASSSQTELSSEIGRSLERISGVQVFDANMLLQVLDEVLADSVSADEYDLIVIDSFSSLMYPLLGKKGYLGNGILHHVATLLRSLAGKFRCPIVLTSFEAYQSEADNKRKQGLGQWWSYSLHHRICLDNQGRARTSLEGLTVLARLESSVRCLRTCDAVGLADASTMLCIGNLGVTDPT